MQALKEKYPKRFLAKGMINLFWHAGVGYRSLVHVLIILPQLIQWKHY
jgi:hypothetical protein